MRKFIFILLASLMFVSCKSSLSGTKVIINDNDVSEIKKQTWTVYDGLGNKYEHCVREYWGVSVSQFIYNGKELYVSGTYTYIEE